MVVGQIGRCRVPVGFLTAGSRLIDLGSVQVSRFIPVHQFSAADADRGAAGAVRGQESFLSAASACGGVFNLQQQRELIADRLRPEVVS